MNKQEFLQRYQHIRCVPPENDFPLQADNRQAAVLLPIIAHANELTLLLTKRAQHLKHHPGQISFPGGKVESSDNSVEQTAIREAHEEVGILPSMVDVIGKLPQYRTITRYTITPVLGFVRPPLDIYIDANEVEQAFEVQLTHICNPKNHIVYPLERNGIKQTLYFIPYKEHMIWGVTAAIIRNLSNHLFAIN